MPRNIPTHLERAVAESGDLQAEVMLGLVAATEEQTEALEQGFARIAAALEHGQGLARREPFIGSLQPDAH